MQLIEIIGVFLGGRVFINRHIYHWLFVISLQYLVDYVRTRVLYSRSPS